MKIRILGSSVEDTHRRQYVSTYLINGTVAIDAGSLGFHGTPQDQEAVKHVFLTHSHIDHTASLPIFVENAWTPAESCPRVYGIPETLDAVQKHIFNDVLWPDFVAISKITPPFLAFCPLADETTVDVCGLHITPVRVNHLVPAVGYVIKEGESTVIFGGDSGPTNRLWEIAHCTAGLRAVFMEACFPNQLSGLASASRHLTPEVFAREAAKIPGGVVIIAVHLKVRYRDQVVRELQDLRLPNLVIGECEKEYDF